MDKPEFRSLPVRTALGAIEESKVKMDGHVVVAHVQSDALRAG
jgi:hypothetical protein